MLPAGIVIGGEPPREMGILAAVIIGARRMVEISDEEEDAAA